jgi:protein-disulfide isomerase
MRHQSGRDTQETSRRSILAGFGGAAGLTLLPVGSAAAPLSQWERDGEPYLGRATARLVMLEYASFTCPHCAAFHRDVLPGLKRTLFDTGRVRYVFRPMLTGPVELAGALQLTAECGPAANRFAVIDALMARQEAIFQATERGGALAVVAAASQSAGGANQSEIEACLTDQARVAQLRDRASEGSRLYGITGTPSLVLNGVRLEPGNTGFTVASVTAAVVAAERGLRPRARR